MLVQIDAAALELNQSLANDIETILSSSGIKRRYLEVTYDPTNNIIAFRSSTKALTSKHCKISHYLAYAM